MHSDLTQTIGLLTASLRNGQESLWASESIRARAAAASAIDRFVGTGANGQPAFVNDQRRLLEQADGLAVQGVMALIDAVNHAGSLGPRVLPLVREHRALLERAGIKLDGVDEKKELSIAN